MAVIGIDLAALETRPSGFCIKKKKEIKTKILYSDDEIINLAVKIKPAVIAIDAPLSLPKASHYRKCDMLIRKAGIPIFSFNLPSLKKLAKRGLALKKKLKKKLKAKRGKKFKTAVIETYPYAVLKMRKPKIKRRFRTKHEKDAFICALVAAAYLKKTAKKFSGGGTIWY